jgi:uncharacterized membrane protein YeaQ/YmgE (transglycosylase-associated protein family)
VAYNKNYMNKMMITIGMGVGSTVGAFLPQAWGDSNLLGGMSILLGLVGGIIGIWLGVKLSKMLS